MNSLLDYSGLPQFSDFKIDEISPALDALLEQSRALIAISVAQDTPATWLDFVQPLEECGERLHRTWGQVSHLNAVLNSPELRDAYNDALPRITQHYTEVAQHLGLFRKYQALKASPAFAQLSLSQKTVIEHKLRDFRLGGAELSKDKKARYLEINERLATLAAKFSDNLLDATDSFALVIVNEQELAGVPVDVLDGFKQDAGQARGWKLTLHAPCYVPVMQYATNRQLRETLYRAYTTRAAEYGNMEWNNTPLIQEIVTLRQEQAKLLGFEHYAALSLETKMAKSAYQVLEFLEDLGRYAKSYAQRDYDELKKFAREALGLDELYSWDVAYAAEKLRVKQYAFSEQEVKHYFPETQVLPGLFKLVETLYELTIRPEKTSVWHEDVRFFSIVDRDGTLVGQFYLDLYARAGKRGGAWMDDAIVRQRTAAGVQVPVAYLTCNFSRPSAGRPALFSHDDVITLFHEFGHTLHHLLTRVEDASASGINGVEWDAVELPSQFMENFCWEWDVLKHMTRHVESGQALPRALFDKMLAAKNFHMGLQTVRQLEFAIFDMRLHSDFDAQGALTPSQLLDEIRKKVAVIIPPNYNRFPNSFSHIFAGGYAAGYYSYKWAEVLSADAYSLFEETGVLNRDTGQRFRSEILSMGGSRPALESFVAFRGREPKIDALLRHNGLANA